MNRFFITTWPVLLSVAICACRGPASSGSQQTPITAPIPVEQFVRQTFVHGVPYAEASRYGVEAVPVLLRMLKDPEMEAYWPNIVVTLGMIGNPLAVPGIIEFIERDPEKALSATHYAAKTGAIMALGYLNHLSNNERCLGYLSNSTNPSFWKALELEWSSPFQSNPEERDQALARMAILGLALAGNDRADQALQNLKTSQVSPADRMFLDRSEDLVEEAIHTCRLIGRNGLAQYYEDARH